MESVPEQMLGFGFTKLLHHQDVIKKSRVQQRWGDFSHQTCLLARQEQIGNRRRQRRAHGETLHLLIDVAVELKVVEPEDMLSGLKGDLQFLGFRVWVGLGVRGFGPWAQ